MGSMAVEFYHGVTQQWSVQMETSHKKPQEIQAAVNRPPPPPQKKGKQKVVDYSFHPPVK